MHGLSTGIESTKSKDSTLENGRLDFSFEKPNPRDHRNLRLQFFCLLNLEISTSISEALNASSSSSLTSVSSPKSDRDDDFEDADEGTIVNDRM